MDVLFASAALWGTDVDAGIVAEELLEVCASAFAARGANGGDEAVHFGDREARCFGKPCDGRDRGGCDHGVRDADDGLVRRMKLRFHESTKRGLEDRLHREEGYALGTLHEIERKVKQ